MASMLKLGGSSSISSRTRMPNPRFVIFVVSAAAVRQERAARRASADDETESMVDLVFCGDDVVVCGNSYVLLLFFVGIYIYTPIRKKAHRKMNRHEIQSKSKIKWNSQDFQRKREI